MLTVKDKHVVVGADFAGHPLKEAVKAHLEERGWTVTDLTPDAESAPMYHRVGFALGAQIAEGKFERALAFCGTGMGIHIAASKCPHVHAAFLESSLGSGYEAWDGFYEYHRIGYDECENFDYEAYKANGFEVVDPGSAVLAEQPKGLAY